MEKQISILPIYPNTLQSYRNERWQWYVVKKQMHTQNVSSENWQYYVRITELYVYCVELSLFEVSA